MKATLKFNLPEELVEHAWAVQAPAMASAINEAMEQMRAWLKHGHAFESPDKAIEECRDLLMDVAALASGDVR